MTHRLIQVHAIGQCLIKVGRRAFRPDAEMVFATLLLLAADRGRRVERDVITKCLWPHDPVQARRHNLRQVLYKLRGAGVDFGEVSGTLMLRRDDVWLDFEDGDRTVVEDEPSGGLSSVHFLPGFTPEFSAPFSEWLDGFRERGESQLRVRLIDAIAASRRDGKWDKVEHLARECIQLDPLNEEANLALAEAIALSGGKSKAVAMLDAYMTDLGDNDRDIRVPASILRKRITERLIPAENFDGIGISLVGREEIIGRLTNTLHLAKSGKASAHLVWGQSGIGKTRVLEEFCKIATLMGGSVFRLQASPDDKLTPGLSVVRLMKSLLEAPGALGMNPEVLALLRSVTTTPNRSEEIRSVGLADDDLVRVLVDLTRAITEERLTVVTFDDLHSADELSRRVIGRAFACLTSERICLVVASIPRLPLAGFDRAEIDRLERLSRDSATELAQRIALATGSAVGDEVVDRVAVASGGNPFVLRETLLACLRDSTHAPAASIGQTLKRRINALSSEGRDLLFTSLALGEHATVNLLLACSQLLHSEIERALGELEYEQILRVSETGRIDIHGLWYDISSTLLPTGTSIARRHRIAEVLERAADQSVDAAELLLASAAQYERAGDSVRAAAVLARGGEELRRRSLAPGAHAAYSRAAALSPASDDFDKRLAQAIIMGWQARQTGDVAALIGRFGERLTRSRSISPEEHAELTVIRVELPGAIMEYPDSAPAIQVLRSSQPLTQLQRLRVAIAGIQAADHNYDGESVAKIGALVQHEKAEGYLEQRLAQQIEIVRAVSSRGLALACDIATDVLAQITSEEVPFAECRLILNTRVPFWFDCDFARVLKILDRVRQTLDLYPGTVDALRLHDIQASYLIEMMRLDEAEALINDISQSVTNGQFRGLQHNIGELQLRLSLARGGEPVDEEVEKSLASTSQLPGCVRHRTFALCNAAIGLARHPAGPLLHSVVDELFQHWPRVAASCAFDYPCIALAIGLKAIGRRAEAQALLDQYAQVERIARHPPTAYSRFLMDQFALEWRGVL